MKEGFFFFFFFTFQSHIPAAILCCQNVLNKGRFDWLLRDSHRKPGLCSPEFFFSVLIWKGCRKEGQKKKKTRHPRDF